MLLLRWPWNGLDSYNELNPRGTSHFQDDSFSEWKGTFRSDSVLWLTRLPLTISATGVAESKHKSLFYSRLLFNSICCICTLGFNCWYVIANSLSFSASILPDTNQSAGSSVLCRISALLFNSGCVLSTNPPPPSSKLPTKCSATSYPRTNSQTMWTPLPRQVFID